MPFLLHEYGHKMHVAAFKPSFKIDAANYVDLASFDHGGWLGVCMFIM
jgi:hypothetical protein